MADSSQDLVKRALLQLRDMRARLDASERQRNEPIAIVGIGCRFPGGVTDPESFWELLSDGRDAITEVPAARWDLNEHFDPDPETPGKMYTRYGGFIDGIDRFDAAFFGITPREAVAMDPQQRQLLEVSWEALERAGQAPDRLMGQPVGVFVGLSGADYLQLHLRNIAPEDIDNYLATGGSPSVAAGRLSYVLGLQGPCVTVDTACSSSLVAVHLAVQSLRARECASAIAGGVSAILLPELTINFSRARMMAADGRCKTFDARADGYVRGEGCGVVVLKRLSDAQAAGDRILAVIRGSAINQDGRSSGLTVPNGVAQQELIREALERGGVSPLNVDYVEAHGTGTSLGDPIELRALGAALTQQRTGAPLLVGSVKTNIGHLEAAAGIAGLIKVVLALQHDEIPPHLHFTQATPMVDWQALRLSVPSVRTPWPGNGHPRSGGVSSFGFSGTNAHVVIEEAPSADARAQHVDRTSHVLTVSGRSRDALRQAAGGLRDFLREHPETELADAAFTRNAGRTHFSHRLAIVDTSAAGAEDQLSRWLDGRQTTIVDGTPDVTARPRIAFLFTGQGSQYPDMGRALYDTHPVFKAALDRCAEILSAHIDKPLLSLLYGDDRHLLDRTCYTQPALFALEHSLAELWKSWGIEPDVVIGHSLGEDVAAAVAGVFSLEDGLKLVAERGRLMETLAAPGEMHAVFAPLAAVTAALQTEASEVSIAAVNGPENIAISGTATALAPVLAGLTAAGVKTKRMNAAYGFHSRLMDPVMAPFERVARQVQYSEPRITFVSNITGRAAGRGEVSNAAYWRRHVREAVQFCRSVQELDRLGVSLVVEIGPAPVLIGMARRCAGDDTAKEWVASLRKDANDGAHMLQSLAALYVKGAVIDWQQFDAPFVRRKLALPTYPFARERFWIEDKAVRRDANGDPALLWTTGIAAGRQQSQEGPLDLTLSTYPAKWDLLTRVTGAYITRAFEQLKAFGTAGESWTVAQLCEARRIHPQYAHLLNRWCLQLAARGLVRVNGDRFEAVAPVTSAVTPALEAERDRVLADYSALAEYVRRSGEALAAVLTGSESPLELLFPGGSDALAERLYNQSPVARYFNGIARSIVQAAASAAPTGTLRILEIGAGTGGTTAAVLPVLNGARTTYRFTDVGPLFLDRAKEKFAAYPFVEYTVLDIEQPPSAQGYGTHQFDVVIAANVLHATRNLDVTLRHVRELLAPSGLLVAVEATEHPVWFDITTGLISGWQRFEDAWRGEHPLLSTERWRQALAAAGFEESECLPEAGAPASILGQHVVVARGPRAIASGAVVSGAVCVQAASRNDGVAATSADAAAELLAELKTLTAAERRSRLIEYVRAAVIKVLRLDALRAPAKDQRLMELGIDSLMAVELRNLLGKGLATPRRLPATLMFDYPTIEAIADFLGREFVSPVAEPAVPVPVPARADAAALESMDDDDVEALLNERLGRI